MTRSAIVLAGGFSRRMGRDKAWLPFGNETLLERVMHTVASVVDEVVVVAREGQEVPGNYRVVHDPAEGLGPLAGLVAGLEAMAGDCAFLSACDAPFLRPALIERLFELGEGHAIAIPRIDGYLMTTCAVYGSEVLPVARRLVEERRLRPAFLTEALDTRIVEAGELRDADPDLESFRNCNTPEAYEAALRDAGLA
jgi:molybdopterin-guanine dinucleotide biosynthesis protein A